MPISSHEFTVEKLKTEEGVRELNSILSKLSRNTAGDGESLKVFNGFASPSGVVSAGVGSVYLREDGSAGTSIYIKERNDDADGWETLLTSVTETDSFPAGGIIMWSGAVADIPSGWVLCDGTNSAPDLTARFVICAEGDTGNTYDVGDTGDGTIPSHQHTFATYDNSIVAMGQRVTRATNTAPNTGSVDAFGTGTENIAKFYALAYIMKS